MATGALGELPTQPHHHPHPSTPPGSNTNLLDPAQAHDHPLVDLGHDVSVAEAAISPSYLGIDTGPGEQPFDAVGPAVTDPTDNASPTSNSPPKQKGGKKRDRTSLRKAPQAPKRFKSSYICFFIAKQPEIKKTLGEKASVTEVSKKSAELWKSLSKEDRAHWDQIAAKDKQRYMDEKAAYTGPWQVPWKRAKKDPSAPKRPMSAFLYFSQGKRQAIKDKNPGMKNTEISRILGEMWRNAPEEERKPHVEMEKAERAKYKVATAKWKEDFKAKAKAEKALQAEQAAMWRHQHQYYAPHQQQRPHPHHHHQQQQQQQQQQGPHQYTQQPYSPPQAPHSPQFHPPSPHQHQHQYQNQHQHQQYVPEGNPHSMHATAHDPDADIHSPHYDPNMAYPPPATSPGTGPITQPHQQQQHQQQGYASYPPQQQSAQPYYTPYPQAPYSYPYPDPTKSNRPVILGPSGLPHYTHQMPPPPSTYSNYPTQQEQNTFDDSNEMPIPLQQDSPNPNDIPQIHYTDYVD